MAISEIPAKIVESAAGLTEKKWRLRGIFLKWFMESAFMR